MRKKFLAILAMVMLLVSYTMNAQALTFANTQYTSISSPRDSYRIFCGTKAQSKPTGNGNAYLAGKVRLYMSNPPSATNGDVDLRIYSVDPAYFPSNGANLNNYVWNMEFEGSLPIGQPDYIITYSPWPSASQYYAQSSSTSFGFTTNKCYVYAVATDISASVCSSIIVGGTMSSGSFSPSVIS